AWTTRTVARRAAWRTGSVVAAHHSAQPRPASSPSSGISAQASAAAARDGSHRLVRGRWLRDLLAELAPQPAQLLPQRLHGEQDVHAVRDQVRAALAQEVQLLVERGPTVDARPDAMGARGAQDAQRRLDEARVLVLLRDVEAYGQVVRPDQHRVQAVYAAQLVQPLQRRDGFDVDDQAVTAIAMI